MKSVKPSTHSLATPLHLSSSVPLSSDPSVYLLPISYSIRIYMVM